MEYEITFYYKLGSRFAEDNVYAVKQCKAPKRTKIWKELQRKLNMEEVASIGYKTNVK